MPVRTPCKLEELKEKSEMEELEEDELMVKGYHFNGFSFYNDCYDFEDDLSKI